ncbi:MAG: right-handed parallel beta-helix repeat-containing protein [Candidatus Rokuibacteriota bacterium]
MTRRTMAPAVAAMGLLATWPATMNSQPRTRESNAARVLRVGPGRELARPSQAARVASDGDTVEIDAAVYEGDVATWRADHLTVRGVGGRARLRAAGQAAEDKAIWVIRGRNNVVEDVEFSGTRVPGRNGAGIRQEGADLTIRRCLFHDNENGVLLGGGPDSETLIEDSEFAENGAGDGRSHNIYIVAVRRLVLRGSYVHHARIGHNVKSRARETVIAGNRIVDEATGTSSYAIDLPNGGAAYIIGNVVQKGPRAEHRRMVAYGAEGIRHPVNELYLVNNTLVNDRGLGGVFVAVWSRSAPVRLVNNIFGGRGTVLSGGRGDLTHNLVARQPGFLDAASYDYRLRPDSPAIDAGVDPGSANGVDLAPRFEYAHPARRAPRPTAGAIDIGAHEYGPARP